MATTCTRCENSGFLNLAHLPDDVVNQEPEQLLAWLDAHSDDYPDVTVCDCCGDGEGWYGTPGEHYGDDFRAYYADDGCRYGLYGAWVYA